MYFCRVAYETKVIGGVVHKIAIQVSALHTINTTVKSDSDYTCTCTSQDFSLQASVGSNFGTCLKKLGYMCMCQTEKI